MPRYFLNIIDHDETIADPDGSEFATFALAQAEALRSVRELVASRILQGRSLDHMRINVCDGEGLVLGTITAQEVVKFD
ncbi:hypothetical protein GCM10007989_07180 [Devosia pacifica]|uniref:DUF6894 domain-containing protein n=1 Tax=Devosia pacifica TaxID=1335967 RepID=A0A918RZM5_9HYPH|nr:hypothetical protein GCM10007989_07180 [Devosia pacifica]